MSSSPPDRLWSPAPAAALPLLSSGWAEARTSSTDKADLYLLTSLSSPARGPTAAVSDRRTRLGLSDHRVPESDSGSARWHTAAAMTVPQCGMGRGLTTDEWAGTDTLSELEAWLAQRLFTGTSHRHGDGPTPAAAADAVPTQTVGPGPCGPVAAGCYGASAAELELEGVLLVLSGCRPLTGTVTAARPAECHSLAA